MEKLFIASTCLGSSSSARRNACRACASMPFIEYAVAEGEICVGQIGIHAKRRLRLRNSLLEIRRIVVVGHEDQAIGQARLRQRRSADPGRAPCGGRPSPRDCARDRPGRPSAAIAGTARRPRGSSVGRTSSRCCSCGDRFAWSARAIWTATSPCTARMSDSSRSYWFDQSVSLFEASTSSAEILTRLPSTRTLPSTKLRTPSSRTIRDWSPSL